MPSQEVDSSTPPANIPSNSTGILESTFSNNFHSLGSTRSPIIYGPGSNVSAEVFQHGNDDSFLSIEDGSTLQAKAYSAISTGYSSASSPFDSSYNLELGDIWNADALKVADAV